MILASPSLFLLKPWQALGFAKNCQLQGSSAKFRKVRPNQPSSGKFGRIRESSAEFGKVRESSAEFGKVRESSGKFGRVRESSGKFGRIRESSAEFGKVRESSASLAKLAEVLLWSPIAKLKLTQDGMIRNWLIENRPFCPEILNRNMFFSLGH